MSIFWFILTAPKVNVNLSPAHSPLYTNSFTRSLITRSQSAAAADTTQETVLSNSQFTSRPSGYFLQSYWILLFSVARLTRRRWMQRTTASPLWESLTKGKQPNCPSNKITKLRCICVLGWGRPCEKEIEKVNRRKQNLKE